MGRKGASLLAVLAAGGWSFAHFGAVSVQRAQRERKPSASKQFKASPGPTSALLPVGLVAIAGTATRSSFRRWSPVARAANASFKLFGPEGPTVLLSSTLIGLSTGCAVVVFEGIITTMEELREELPLPVIAPLLGALVLAGIFTAFGGKEGLAGTDIKSLKSYAAAGGPEPPENWPLRAAGNALSAAITLGSGNSLGPEAPAATLGANVAFGLGQVFSIFGTQATLDEAAPKGPPPSKEDCELIERALSGSKVVASLPGKDLDKLLTFFQEVRIKAGDNLMKHGDQVADDEPGLFVTKTGELDVYVPDGGQEKKVFAYEESGQVVGELAVLFRAPRAATVKARTDAVLLSVDRCSFEACGGRSEGSMARINQNPDALLASGAAAGVAAGFNAPIAGIFFASEVVRPGDDNSLDLTTRLLAAAVSAAVVQSFLPGGPAIKTTNFSWDGGNGELFLFIILGVLTGMIAYGYKKIVASSRDIITWVTDQGVPNIWLPIAGALVTVLISLLTCARVQFDGFGAVNEVLRDASEPLGEAASNLSLAPLIENRGSIGLFGAAPLLALMVLKIFSTAFSSVSGLVGGTFAPSIYIGACLGGALGRMIEGAAIAHSAATTYIVVGMASMLAANCSVPITSVVLAVELAGGASYEATLPLITGIGVALYVSAVLLPALLDGLDRDAALQRLGEAAEDTGL